MAAVADLHEAGIDGGGKERVLLQRGADCRDGSGRHVVHDADGVRVAHADDAHFQRLARGADRLVEALGLGGGEGGEVRLAHIDAVLFAAVAVRADVGDGDAAAFDGDAQRAVERVQAVVAQVFAEAARAVAAVFDFAAVGVVDAVGVIVRGIRRGFDDEQLVKADAAVAVGQRADARARPVEGLLQGIQDDEVVTEAVHFAETADAHRRATAFTSSRMRMAPSTEPINPAGWPMRYQCSAWPI